MSAPLLSSSVKTKLRTRIIGRTVHCFRELPSTNDMAKELASIGAKEGTVVVAGTQTQGRGRLGREWFSPKGGLWFSVVLRPEVSAKEAPKLTLLTAVAAAKTLKKQFRLEAEVKWPNDVLVAGKKVCGILTESSSKGDSLNFVVVGVGVNVNFKLDVLPANLHRSATTLREELKREVELEPFLLALLLEIDRYYSMFVKGKFDAVLAEWRRLAARFLGSPVEVVSADEKVEGWAVDIDEEGALILKLKDQTLRRVLSGDVILLRRKMVG